MVKVSSRDALAILRRFDQANDENVPREIDQLRITHPNAISTMASFRFNKQLWYALFDDSAEDDTEYVLQQIQTDKTDITGEVLENPQDHTTTYALPFKGKDVYLFLAVPQSKRLDIVLAERYPEYSRSTWQKYIKGGHVSVNGEVQTSSKADVTNADKLSIDLPAQTDYSEQSLPIIYLDDNVIVINKPIGVLTHAKGALNDEFTVAEFFRRYTTVGLDTNRPGIIHRLDRDTSGVMIGARTELAATMLKKQFAERRTKKTYIAVVDGHLKQSEALIDLPIGRNPSAPSTFRVDAIGKSALTNYKVLTSNNRYDLVELRPQTGRTHQLRVHMSYLGTPIHGDQIYGKAADRLYLHAKSLEITIPISERRTFEASVPPEFENLLKES